MKIWLLTFFFLASTSAWANNWYDRGNAGFVLFCEGQAPVVLDIHEARQRSGRALIYSQQFDVIEKVHDLIARLEKVDAQRASLYHSWAQNFFLESTALTPSTELVQTPDLGYVSLPANCQLKQVIFQRNPSALNQHRYIIDTALWNQLDINQQAALVLHEIVYREFMTARTSEMTSERIRMFNGLVHLHGFEGLSLSDYIQILQELHFTTYTYNGLVLSLGAADAAGYWQSNALYFEKSDFIAAAVLAGKQAFEFDNVKFVCLSDERDLGVVTFQSSGKFKTLRVAPEFARQSECALPFMEYATEKGRFTVTGTDWVFHQNGHLVTIRGAVSPSTPMQFKYGEVNYASYWNPFAQTFGESYFEFDEQLNLRALGLGGSACRNPLNNSVQFIPQPYGTDTIVSIGETGRLDTELPACF
ncbi:MAG: hypothetical protein OM95_11185 [Bdellovibrio sp. ArHS]|uniref:hypothetical protein n=1 Tax=Bdellovibrio sp. ArHS TaxID=1569284 RepID=UPI000582E52E|nr:hypothetical protein [Bdellovibrio sp. ArHS]KHD88075.1 MAG: hypothetical protein OM95_11185 [Bdellovibrio sp. ArHS]